MSVDVSYCLKRCPKLSICLCVSGLLWEKLVEDSSEKEGNILIFYSELPIIFFSFDRLCYFCRTVVQIVTARILISLSLSQFSLCIFRGHGNIFNWFWLTA